MNESNLGLVSRGYYGVVVLCLFWFSWCDWVYLDCGKLSNVGIVIKMIIFSVKSWSFNDCFCRDR